MRRPWVRLALLEAAVVCAGIGAVVALASALDPKTLSIGLWLRTG
jgi:hypothetical protein